MREYELTVLYDLAVAEAGGPDASVELLTHHVEARGGKVLRVDHWGRRRLAYPIQRAIDADYIVSRIELETTAVSPLEAALGIDEKVMRHLIVRADELPVPPPPREPRQMPGAPATPPISEAAPTAPEAPAAPVAEASAPDSAPTPAETAPSEEAAPAPDAQAPDVPAVDAPVAETPVAEPPVAEVPVAETPAADASAADASASTPVASNAPAEPDAPAAAPSD